MFFRYTGWMLKLWQTNALVLLWQINSSKHISCYNYNVSKECCLQNWIAVLETTNLSFAVVSSRRYVLYATHSLRKLVLCYLIYSLLILGLSVLVSGPLWHVFIGLNDSCGPCLLDRICVLHSLKTHVFFPVFQFMCFLGI